MSKARAFLRVRVRVPVLLLQAVVLLCLLAAAGQLIAQIVHGVLSRDPIRRSGLMRSPTGGRFGRPGVAGIVDGEFLDDGGVLLPGYGCTGDHGGGSAKVEVEAGSDPDVEVEEEPLLGSDYDDDAGSDDDDDEEDDMEDNVEDNAEVKYGSRWHGDVEVRDNDGDDDVEDTNSSGQDAAVEGLDDAEDIDELADAEDIEQELADVEDTEEIAGSGCPECGKLFKNDKSMYGHLRSHPNKGYKGARPPVKNKSLSNCSDASPVPEDHHAGKSQRASRITPRDMFAAFVLFTLQYRGNQSTRPAAPAASPEHASPPERHGDQDAELATPDNVERRKRSESSAVDGPGKKRRKLNEGEEKGTRQTRPPYVCKLCRAEFSTHQALGGHIAAHNKEKRNQAQTEKEAGAPDDQNQNGQEAPDDQNQNGQEAAGNEDLFGQDPGEHSESERNKEH